MKLIEALIFGIVQGITEFLPVSSTAHIIITEHLLGYHFPGLAFEIYLHVASAFAVMLYFHRELRAVVNGFFRYFSEKNTENRVHFLFGLYIIIATVITGVLGLLLKEMVGETMKTPAFLAGALSVTGTALIVIERFHKYGNRTYENMNFWTPLLWALARPWPYCPAFPVPVLH